MYGPSRIGAMPGAAIVKAFEDAGRSCAGRQEVTRLTVILQRNDVSQRQGNYIMPGFTRMGALKQAFACTHPDGAVSIQLDRAHGADGAADKSHNAAFAAIH